MTFSPKAFTQTVTCPSCSKKTHGYPTARDTITCDWCGKLFEDKKRDIDLFPNIQREKKHG